MNKILKKQKRDGELVKIFKQESGFPGQRGGEEVGRKSSQGEEREKEDSVQGRCSAGRSINRRTSESLQGLSEQLGWGMKGRQELRMEPGFLVEYGKTERMQSGRRCVPTAPITAAPKRHHRGDPRMLMSPVIIFFVFPRPGGRQQTQPLVR